MENKHHTSCNSLIGADRDRSRTARSRGMFCCRFPAKSHSRRRCALTVTSLQSKCGHFAWFIWQSKMNGKVEDLTWRFVILYGFPEPVRFQSTYFPNCILSFTNSVKPQSKGWRMVKSETRRDAEILVRNPSPRLFGEKFRDSKKVKTNHEKTRLRDLSKTFPRFRDRAKIFRDPRFSRYHSPPLK